MHSRMGGELDLVLDVLLRERAQEEDQHPESNEDVEARSRRYIDRLPRTPVLPIHAHVLNLIPHCVRSKFVIFVTSATVIGASGVVLA